MLRTEFRTRWRGGGGAEGGIHLTIYTTHVSTQSTAKVEGLVFHT